MGNPYGRLLTLMKSQANEAADSVSTFQVGTMLTGAQIKLPGRVLARDDYLLLYNDFIITIGDDSTYVSVPYKATQKVSFKATDGTVTIKAVPFEKGDEVACIQINDGKFLVLGKVAEFDDR